MIVSLKMFKDKLKTSIATQKETQAIICLVIGHSKKSKGAYNKNLDISEYDLNKQEAIRVHEILKEQGIRSIVIHRKELKDLPKKINKHNPRFIISFHHNSFSETSTGSETLYYHSSTKGKHLAEVIQRNIVSVLGYKDRGIRPKCSEDRGGFLLRYTNAPCIILEPCFISNTKELKDFILKQDLYIEAIVAGIKEFIGLSIKHTQSMKRLT